MVLRALEKTLTLHVRDIVLVNYVLMVPTVPVSHDIAVPGFVKLDVRTAIMIANAAQVKCVVVYILLIKVTALNLV